MENEPIEIKCENLMNVVVETRKRFGKSCLEYDQKILKLENKLLDLELAKTSNMRFKPKYQIPSTDADSCEDSSELLRELAMKQKRIEDLRKKLKNTREIITQLNTDTIGKKLSAPLTVETLLAQAAAKNDNFRKQK